MTSAMHQHLQGVYQAFRAKVALINQAIGHTATQGAETELDIRDLLTSVLPSNYGIGSGRIIGTDGNASNQIDVVVFDKTRPNYLLSSDSKLYLVDHVVATIEVKTTWTSGSGSSLEQALENCKSVKRLRVSEKQWHEQHFDPQTGRSDSRLYRPTAPLTIVFFFGASDTQESRDIDSFYETLKSAVDAHEIQDQPDLLCSLDHGSFFRHRDLAHTASTGEYFSSPMLTEDTGEPIQVKGVDKKTKEIVDLAGTSFIDGTEPSHIVVQNSKGTSKAIVITQGERISLEPLTLRVGRVDKDKFFVIDHFRAFLMFVHSLESLLSTKHMNKNWSIEEYFGVNYFNATKLPDDL